LRSDRGASREMISVTLKPAWRSDIARNVARFPEPTIAMEGFAVEGLLRRKGAFRFPVPDCRFTGAAYLILVLWRNRT
jgi:hypothetical protein